MKKYCFTIKELHRLICGYLNCHPESQRGEEIMEFLIKKCKQE